MWSNLTWYACVLQNLFKFLLFLGFVGPDPDSIHSRFDDLSQSCVPSVLSKLPDRVIPGVAGTIPACVLVDVARWYKSEAPNAASTVSSLLPIHPILRAVRYGLLSLSNHFSSVETSSEAACTGLCQPHHSCGVGRRAGQAEHFVSQEFEEVQTTET
jgi:hypothetical protein